MLTKLAFKNVGKSMRDYAVYFFTLVLGVSIFYMFNSIYDQKDIMVVTETVNASMQALNKILSIISVFVAIVLGFLIIYANNFFIKRRKKELGIYMTLGMDKRKISTILVLETSLMAIVALIIGIIIGIFGSQFMSVFTAKIFEANMTEYKFVFSSKAMIKSIVYFAIIFFVVIIFNMITINKYKLIDLLYGGRKNETLKIEKIWKSVIIFLISIICLAVAYTMILKYGIVDTTKVKFFSSIILGVIGTILFFFSLSGMITKLIKSKKSVYFKNLNMFVTRQLGSKINTNFVSVSVVCLILFLVIGIFSTGYSMQNVLSKELKTQSAYDVSMFNFQNEDESPKKVWDRLPNNLKKSKLVKSHAEVKLYRNDQYNRFNVLLNDKNKKEKNIIVPISFVGVEDYNSAMKMIGKKEVSLKDNQYLVVYDNPNLKKKSQSIIDKNVKLKLEGDILSPLSKISSNSPSAVGPSLRQIYFVVSDQYVKHMKCDIVCSNINCFNNDGLRNYVNMLKEYQKKDKGNTFIYFTDRLTIYQNSVSTKAIVSFLAIYLGIVFMIACAAILAIQQLSEATDNKERYELLHKLGTNKKMLNKALFTQVLSYFLLPFTLAIVHSAVGLSAANKVIKAFGNVDITQTIGVTAIFVVIVYGIYFLMTYIGSKSIINKR